MHGIIRFFSSFFLWFNKQKSKFNQIRSDEEMRRKSIIFGVNSILFILIGFTLSALALFAGIFFVSQGEGGLFGVFFSVVFGIILIASGGIAMPVTFIYALASSVFQLRMNRKIIGILSLLICIAITVGGIILGLNVLDNTF